MPRSRDRRAAALFVLAGLFLWNAPAMAFPALLAPATDCKEVAPAGGHQHHAGMHHTMPPLRPPQPMTVRHCVEQHTCCRFNREPGRKSEAVSLADVQVPSARLDVYRSQREGCGRVSVEAQPPLRAVFDQKSDMRI